MLGVILGIQVDNWRSQRTADDVTQARLNVMYREMVYNERDAITLFEAARTTQRSLLFNRLRFLGARAVFHDDNLQNILPTEVVLAIQAYVMDGESLDALNQLGLEVFRNIDAEPKAKGKTLDAMKGKIVERSADFLADVHVLKDKLRRHCRLESFTNDVARTRKDELEAQRDAVRAKLLEGKYTVAD